jgi:hypothetical protein
MQVSAARWVAEHLPADAAIAIQDAGAMRYFTRNPLIDLVGLNSHDYLFAADKAAYLRSVNLRYIVIFAGLDYDPLFDFETRTLVRFVTPIPGISIGSNLEVREVIGIRDTGTGAAATGRSAPAARGITIDSTPAGQP